MTNPKLREIYDYIVLFYTENQVPPTHQEMVDAGLVAGKSIAAYYLWKLVDLGVLTIAQGGQARKIRVEGGQWTMDSAKLAASLQHIDASDSK